MPMPRIDVDENTVQKARHLYENTKVPLPRIADMMHMSARTFLKRRIEWGWRSRTEVAAEMRMRLAALMASTAHTLPSRAVEADGVEGDNMATVTDGAATDGAIGAEPPVTAPPAGEGAPRSHAELVRRISRAIEGEIAATEAYLNVIPRGTARGHLAESGARTLASLVRTLNELKRMQAGEKDATDDCPRDIEALRQALADKLEKLKQEPKAKPVARPSARRHRRPR